MYVNAICIICMVNILYVYKTFIYELFSEKVVHDGLLGLKAPNVFLFHAMDQYDLTCC